MRGKKGLFGLLIAMLSLTTGCCRFCDRMCHGSNSGYAPAAGGQCCYVPCCPTGTVAGSPAVPAIPTVPVAGGWNQPAGACVPCR